MRTPKTNPLIVALAKILAFLNLYPSLNPPAEKTVPCKCRRCGRKLRTEASRAAGIGPVCAKLEKMGAKSCPRAKAKKDKKATDARQLELDFKSPLPGPTGKELRKILGVE
ncbi:hypothetical protein KP005_19310 [Geomonas nitrogeniifigens]|uniref:Uncharacterized protein n=1 Tax=Geomonas diazotrophica TaxID=2843197 RepID=A0ABX8JJV6_9BACT|nr:DUF6011 domain-containing protein [Geomonas nitrogeniifigens]QWV97456.1 hypothetical protein KP005_19310 [Geomonas nitrogeniifigens]